MDGGYSFQLAKASVVLHPWAVPVAGPEMPRYRPLAAHEVRSNAMGGTAASSGPGRWARSGRALDERAHRVTA